MFSYICLDKDYDANIRYFQAAGLSWDMKLDEFSESDTSAAE
jgi:hypothetical protein